MVPDKREWLKTTKSLKSVRIYHESGNLHYEGRIVNGLYEGWGKLSHTNGSLEYEGKFYKGKKYMKATKTYWPNGGEKFMGELLGDLMTGYCHEYHEDGSFKCKGNYKSRGDDSGLDGKNLEVHHPWTSPEDFKGKLTANDKIGPVKFEGKFVRGAFSNGKE